MKWRIGYEEKSAGLRKSLSCLAEKRLGSHRFDRFVLNKHSNEIIQMFFQGLFRKYDVFYKNGKLKKKNAKKLIDFAMSKE